MGLMAASTRVIFLLTKEIGLLTLKIIRVTIKMLRDLSMKVFGKMVSIMEKEF